MKSVEEVSWLLAAYYTRAIVDYSRVRSYSRVQKGSAAWMEGVGFSRGIGRLEDKSRRILVGMKDTVAGIDKMVDVEVLDCVGWRLLVQLRLLPFLPYLV